ncbi:MAG: DUF1684 domain-containing protein [Chloroflexota bacterium]
MSDNHHHHEHEHEHDHHDHVPVEYADAIRGFREDKDDYFRTGAGSPLPPADRAGFGGLAYFDVDESLVFEGLTLEPYAGNEPARFSIPTSDNRLRPAARAGTLRFKVGSVPCSLTAYTFEGSSSTSVFVPFLDGTTGIETYGAGRYLDIEPEDDGTYTVDFNLAYHPSCVYDMRFSCPLTPAENRLPVRIEAGERLAEDHAA